MDTPYCHGRKEAEELDRWNPLSNFRSRFHIPPDTVYMDGNSLGLLSKDAERSILRVLDEWKDLGIGGWMNGEQPWFVTGERLGARMALLVGAAGPEVIFTGTTTINIHQLVGSFYNPSGERSVILADELNFPSDLYALEGQVRIRNLDPEKHLVRVKAGKDRLLDEESIIKQMTPEIALVFLPSVLYRSGQLLDMEKLSAAAAERGIPIGFDCSHSAGAVPHYLSKWGVDFALWCSYKYLNGGPGAPAFLYVNHKHFNLLPSLPGWFGQQKERQFEMLPSFFPASGAGRWQISTPCILGSSPVEGALNITLEAGIERIREVSLRLTGFLADSLNTRLISEYGEFSILTPSGPHRRGGHIALTHPQAEDIYNKLLTRGIITDFRPPDIIRIAPVPLYNTFTEVCQVVDSLLNVVEKR